MKLTLIYIYCLSLFLQDYGNAHSITITIHHIRNNKGTILVNLYKKAEGFPSDRSKAIMVKKIKAKSPFVEITFDAVSGGTYAIAVMHDENDNGKMDKNFLGIPTEGYCVSNNAKGFMSAPSFEAAKFLLNSDVKQILNMIY